MRIDEFIKKTSFTSRKRMRIFEKLSRYLSNGVPISFALSELYKFSLNNGKGNSIESHVISEWNKSIRNGCSLADAMKGWIPEDEIAIISAGEISGDLSCSLNDIIKINETKSKIRSALAGVIYPLVLLMTTCLYLYIFGTQVVPAFASILPVDEWQGGGRTMYYLAVFVQDYLSYCVLLLLLFVFCILISLPKWTGKIRKVMDRFAPWSIYKTVFGCGFLLSLAALMQAGVPAPEALRVIMKTANPWYKERLLAVRYRLLNGDANLGEALYFSGYQFPSKVMIMDLRSYASLGGFDEILSRLSYQWQSETIASIEKQMSVFKNLAIVLMGGVFMWIVSGMFSLQQQISNAAQF